MRAVLQIAENASLTCEGKLISDCKRGMCILLGLTHEDHEAIADKMIDRILKMRIFADEEGKLNLSSLQVGADLLVVSNFTLYANTASRRPDFLRSMKYEPASALYDYFLKTMQKRADELKTESGRGAKVYGGVFGGDMKISLLCDGPVTILLEKEHTL